MFESETTSPDGFRGRRVTVMGLGLFGGGKGATEFLCSRGAEVTVTDLRSAETLAESVRSLAGLPIRWALGGHREEDFTTADLVVVSPAVPRSAPLLRRCRERGVPLETETNLFFKYCRGRICGVTGSNGKTTTTRLLGSMARRRWPGVRVGGNLGRSLLPEVLDIEPGDWVVLELSSFQLEDLSSIDRSPDLAVVTNISPNHLDRHGTYERYREAKRGILGAPGGATVAVLNAEDPHTRSWGGLARRTYFFGRTGTVVPRAPGRWRDELRGRAIFRDVDRSELLFPLTDIPLPGRFNQMNVAAAATAARILGVERDSLRDAITSFRAVEHRLEPVAEEGGIRFVNDSVSTTPESTRAALEALGPRLVLICGGSDKGCSFVALGRSAARWTRAIVTIGETAEAIRRAVPTPSGGPTVTSAQDLREAVAVARSLARPGDTVLLSPACPSYDQFTNFVERGERFKELVRSFGPTRS